MLCVQRALGARGETTVGVMEGGVRGRMAYIIEERLDTGAMSRVGKSLDGFLVARVVATRNATRSGRLTVVKDVRTGKELARFEPNVLLASVKRLRLSNDRLSDRIGTTAKKA